LEGFVVGSGHGRVTTLFAGDFAWIAGIEMVLATVALGYFARFGDAHAFS
jgi:hypothetical protein